MLHLPSSANASSGSLYKTDDTGGTWVELPKPPAGDSIFFSSSTKGWLAGGPGGGELYSTDNGGLNWYRNDPKLPPEIEPQSQPVFDLPIFQDGV
jgi:photosystem II stability/assembly factor-like uncharacterized protein